MLQAFTASLKPYGHFVEIIQRKSIQKEFPNDQLENELFNTTQIDELYRLYDEHSKGNYLADAAGLSFHGSTTPTTE